MRHDPCPTLLEREREIKALKEALKDQRACMISVEKADADLRGRAKDLRTHRERLLEGVEKIPFLATEPEVGNEERLEGIVLAVRNLLAGKRWDGSEMSSRAAMLLERARTEKGKKR
jgi:hypothetical protein